MLREIRAWASVSAVLVFLTGLVSPAAAGIELVQTEWYTQNDEVVFSLLFHNPDSFTSSEATGEVQAEPYGWNQATTQLLTNFVVPPLYPGEYYTVGYQVPLSDLPPSPGKITYVECGGGEYGGCPTDYSWAGGIDISWSGPDGLGHADVHFGNLQVRPAASSYIQVSGFLDFEAPYEFTGVRAGWSVLLLEDSFGMPGAGFSPSLPAGSFNGWIMVVPDAGVSNLETCCFDLNIMGIEHPIRLCTEACVCEPVSTESSTWGRVKSQYMK